MGGEVCWEILLHCFIRLNFSSIFYKFYQITDYTSLPIILNSKADKTQKAYANSILLGLFNRNQVLLHFSNNN
jgi:hypothetical protein